MKKLEEERQMQYLPSAQDSIRAKIRAARRIYLALDYDGTLTPIVSYRKNAFLPRSTKESLRRLASNTRCALMIVSGRRLSEIMHFVDIDRAYYVGNHGLEIHGPRFRFVHSEAKKNSRYLPAMSRQLRNRLRGTCAVVENKGLTLSVHYREVKQPDMPSVRSAVKQILREHEIFEAIYGKKIVDIRPRLSWNKWNALEAITPDRDKYPIIYIGDDRTDEDVFRALTDAITILVSRRPKASAAQYFLKDTGEVATFLALLNSWLQA